VLPGEEVRTFVQRAAGYSATGDISEQCIFIHYGLGANGKSTFSEVVRAALGDYAMKTPTETLLVKRSDNIPNDVARLKGARYVTASETEDGRRLSESLVKEMTGGDTMSARFLHAEWFDFQPTHTVHLSTNHKPEVRGTDHAIWRRIRLVPWTVTIQEKDQDKKLSQKLREELPGILAWIVRGCAQWRSDGLEAPEEVREATKAYRSEMDTLAAFIEEECEVGEDLEVPATPLYKRFCRWCEDAGETSGKQKAFGMRLAERGFKSVQGTKKPYKGLKMWRGIGFKKREDGPEDPDDDPNPGGDQSSTDENAEARGIWDASSNDFDRLPEDGKVDDHLPPENTAFAGNSPLPEDRVDDGRPKKQVFPSREASRKKKPENKVYHRLPSPLPSDHKLIADAEGFETYLKELEESA
jgi:putative DNA primase/helicase